MKVIFAVALAATTWVTKIMADNVDPVVFCHGYGGSSAHLHYVDEFEASGLTIFAADVDPYASNHDRAAELYAQIKGTITDYGVCHSAETEIERFGPDFTGKGFYPQWDENHQIHLIGHSQGGLTVRYLERMLELGSGCAQDTHEMYTGGKHWLTSITTMATPNNGATIFDEDFGKLYMRMLSSKEGAAPLQFPIQNLFQENGETFDEFWNRVESSGLFSSKNFGIYDMNQGARDLTRSGPNVFQGRYYFAVATERTNPMPLCTVFGCETIEVPDVLMNSYYWQSSAIIGSTALPEDRENDGIVSNNQARCPAGEKCIQIPNYDTTTWTPSVWHMIDLDFLDHMQLVERDEDNDVQNFQNSAKRIWLELGARIKKINSKSALTQTKDEAFDMTEKEERVERYLAAMREMSTPVKVESLDNRNGVIALSTVFSVLGVAAILIIYKKMNLRSQKLAETKKSVAGDIAPVTV